VFLGNDPWSAIALEACVDADDPLEPVSVVTRTPKPAGRGGRLRPTAVADAARRLDLALIEVETVREGPGLEALRRTRPDVLAVVAYGELLPSDVLDLPALGCVNLHFSLLPRWRGASPVHRTIQAGDTVTGVTIIQLDEGLDTGPVLARTEVSVEGSEDSGSLGARLAQLGGALLVPTIRSLQEGSLRSVAQPADGVSYAPKLDASDRVVDWTRPSAVIDRRVRAVSPAPGATTTFRGGAMKVVRGEPAPGEGPPGVFLAMDAASGGVEVGTGEGIYRLLEVAPAGKKHMRADAWARGARFRPGERLGTDQPGSDQPSVDRETRR
jgi:methionyl-tRNA formyltransferase